MANLPNNGLLPASFRGVPFVVTNDELGGGRRQAVHQYPGRDDPWAEDMGRAARRFRFRGFIADGSIRFLGGPIQLQRALLIAAFEKKGSGTLTHPTLGILNVSVVGFSVGQDLGAGRMSSVDVEFVESGKQSFPSLLSQSSGILSAANLCKVALAVDVIRVVAAASARGARRKDLTTTAATWVGRVGMLGADATALHRLAAQLPGNYGRFAGGGNSGFQGSNRTILASATTVADLVQVVSESRAKISVAAMSIRSAIAASPLSYQVGLADAANGLAAALAAACADPADAIRLFELLISFVSPRPESRTPIGAAFSNMFRRAAAAQLVIAAGLYQPTSGDDASAKIKEIGMLLGALATAAADAGDDASFAALHAARQAVVQDLRRRGATLAHLATLKPGAPLPALRLAQRYYRDPARADQLVTQTAAPHPLFLPPQFQALAA